MMLHELISENIFDTSVISTVNIKLSAVINYTDLHESIQRYIDNDNYTECCDDNTEITITLEINEGEKYYEIEYTVYDTEGEENTTAEYLKLTAAEQKRIDEYLIRVNMLGIQQIIDNM